jgi:hypothetical protein
MTTEAPRALSTCDQCGQTDDHPKVHIAGPESADTFHHDCLSAKNKALVEASSPQAAAIIEACVKGKRGAALLKHIQSVHKES